MLLSTMLLLAYGCVQKHKRPPKVSREMASQIVSTQAPKPEHALDIRFENKVRLLGYDLSTPQAREGQTFTVTWYWQVDAPLGEGWKVFTHLADAAKHNRVNLDAVRPLRELYPEDSWQKGDFIKDVQEVALPADWHSNAAVFFVGFWHGPNRLRVTVGPNDGDNRAEALSVPVGEPSKPPELPRLIARRLTAPLQIDGKLDEADWSAAQTSGAFVQTMSGERGAFAASARVLYDDKNLYVGYQVADDFLRSTFKKADEHLWEQDAVELMVDPDGDGKNYFEIQVAPTGVVFDTRYDSRRLPQPFGDMAWSSAAKAKVALQGKPNDDENDVGYTVELAIPWTAFAAGPTPAQPPAAGATWRMNFFVMDTRREGQRAVGWSPPLIGDFHTLERFGRVVFPQAAAK
ncbi:MAG: carbohydrate-binding family 9-like protein [Polyangiales bacterium]